MTKEFHNYQINIKYNSSKHCLNNFLYFNLILKAFVYNNTFAQFFLHFTKIAINTIKYFFYIVYYLWPRKEDLEYFGLLTYVWFALVTYCEPSCLYPKLGKWIVTWPTF